MKRHSIVITAELPALLFQTEGEPAKGMPDHQPAKALPLAAHLEAAHRTGFGQTIFGRRISSQNEPANVET